MTTKPNPAFAGIALMAITLPPAHAAVTYNAQVEGNFTITGIDSSSGNLDGLVIEGKRLIEDHLAGGKGKYAPLDPAKPSGIFLTGSEYDPNAPPQMTVGLKAWGEADANTGAHSKYETESLLRFTNTSNDTYNIKLSLDYDASTKLDTVEKNAMSWALLDLDLSDFADPNDFFDAGDGWTLELWSNPDHQDQQNGSEIFTLALGAGETKSISVLAGVEGKLPAGAVSSVPVPAAFWLLGPALLWVRRVASSSAQKTFDHNPV